MTVLMLVLGVSGLCLGFMCLPFMRKKQSILRGEWFSLAFIALSLALTAGWFYRQKAELFQTDRDIRDADISQSLYAKSHLEKTLAPLSVEQKHRYCTAMQRRYQRKLQPEWLANIATCYQKIATAEALTMAQSVVDFGLQTAPHDIALNVMHSQNVMAQRGIHSSEFRAALRHLLNIAPTHRTTLWLASAEAYYRGERSQALAYLTQLRAKVGDEPEIMAFIDAVNALPKAD